MPTILTQSIVPSFVIVSFLPEANLHRLQMVVHIEQQEYEKRFPEVRTNVTFEDTNQVSDIFVSIT